MKAFVIKNKEGKYYEGLSEKWYDSLDRCTYFKNKESAEYERKKLLKLKNCEIIEITVAEGDLEQQLIEKDKEIEELKEFYDNMLRNKLEVKCISATEEKIKEIRKQVCEEIHEELRKQFGKHKDKYLYRENESYNVAIANAISIVNKVELGE